MASRVKFDHRFGDKFKGEMTRRTRAASIRLTAAVKSNISQPGTLRYQTGKSKGGRIRQATVYNYTHSAPGNPPYKQRGFLRRAITYEVLTSPRIIGRVGTNYLVALYLDQGTRRMRRRPFLAYTLNQQLDPIRRILTKKIVGELPPITAMQFRSGVLGQGFYAMARTPSKGRPRKGPGRGKGKGKRKP